jgi:hypothetical protein
VLGGTLHGKTFQLSKEPEEITIGSAPSCRFRLEAAGVAPVHAKIVADETGAALYDLQSPRGTWVNFERVEGRLTLSDGDMIRLGPPQDRESVMLQLEFGGALADAPAPIPPPGPSPFAPSPAPAAPPAGAVSVVSGPDDEALIADLTSGEDQAFVISDEPFETAATSPSPARPRSTLQAPAPQPPAPPIVLAPPPPAPAPHVPAPPPPTPPAAVEAISADEFFVAADPEPEPSVESAPSTPAPRAPETAGTPLGSAPYTGDEGDFALPTFDPNWGAPAAAPPKPAPPGADEFFVSDPQAAATGDFYADEGAGLPPFPAPGPKPAPAPKPPEPGGGLSFTTDEEPLSLQEGAAAAKPAPPSPASPPPPPPAPIAVKPKEPAPTEAPVPRPRPARRPVADEGAAAPARPRAPAPRAKAGGAGGGRTAALAGGGIVVLGVLGFLALRLLGGGAKITAVEPARAKVGQTVTVAGGPFASDPAANEVLFGSAPATVLEGDSSRLKVQVPDVGGAPGQDTSVSVKVRVAGKDSSAFKVTVYGGPTIVGISPDVAMPGEEVVLAGSGWGAAPVVQFGAQAAEVLQATPTSIRVRVPDIAGNIGTAAPATVKDGAVESNPAPFFVGRIPLLQKVEPENAVPGDLVVVSGRGFKRDPAANTATLSGAPALVLSAADSELRLVAPFTALGATGGLELRVAGSDNVAQAAVGVQPSSDVVDFRFATQYLEVAPGRTQVVLASGLGPAFVIAAAGGKSAAERGYEAQQRLNQAGTLLKASRDAEIELRNPDTEPFLALVGKPEPLLEVTEEDAAAYNEDWTGLKGRGGPVTRTRLARWWEAVAKDLVLMLVRGQKPANAPALAPEGRVLVEISAAAQKTGRFGVPWNVVEGLRPPQREAIRVAALRVPPSVTGPGGGAAAGAQAATLKHAGHWVGIEREGGQRRDVSATFGGGTGTISIEAAVTLTLPLITLETRKNEARWSLQFRGGTRHYAGKWDGTVLAGTIANDPAGKDAVGTFELRPR